MGWPAGAALIPAPSRAETFIDTPMNPVPLWRSLRLRLPPSGPASPSVATAAPIPGASGPGEFRNADGIVFYDLVAEVTDRPGAEGAQPSTLGSLVVRRILSAAQTTDTINRLVGGGAVV